MEKLLTHFEEHVVQHRDENRQDFQNTTSLEERRAREKTESKIKFFHFLTFISCGSSWSPTLPIQRSAAISDVLLPNLSTDCHLDL